MMPLVANGLNGYALRVPKWAITALVAATAIAGLAWRVGAKMERIDNRLCRIEIALSIPSDPGCPRP